MKYFFDTSAFAKRYIDEKGSEDVVEYCQMASSLALSSICLPELISTLSRLKREKRISAAQYRQVKQMIIGDIEDVAICQLTVDVLETSISLLEKFTLRAMDALHIACAIEWEAECFVSGDKRQLLAAEKSGLNVLSV